MEVRRVRVGDQVYERMLSMILDGQLPQGSRVDYNKLADSFRTSRVPLREAVQRLVSEGLLVINPKGGTFVITLTLEDISHLFRIRLFLEQEAIRHGFDKINRNKLQKLKKKFLEEAENIDKNKDYKTSPNIYRYDLALHKEMVTEAYGNQIVKNYVGIIYNYTQLAQRMNIRARGSNREHLDIINEIIAGDQEATLRAIETHLKRVESSIVNHIVGKKEE